MNSPSKNTVWQESRKAAQAVASILSANPDSFGIISAKAVAGADAWTVTVTYEEGSTCIDRSAIKRHAGTVEIHYVTQPAERPAVAGNWFSRFCEGASTFCRAFRKA
jgi:hypothetical protein